jgi:hypothetical protein
VGLGRLDGARWCEVVLGGTKWGRGLGGTRWG